jgi:Ser/Thr protein kinase RdoA (MazF antagonist)
MATPGGPAPAQSAAVAVRAAWLTTVLHRSGALPGGRVRRLRILERRRTAGSSLAHCEVEYTKHAPAQLPRRDRPPELLDAMGRKEVAFYRDVAPTLPAAPVPRCLAAEAGADGEWHIVLEDLSATHTQTQWPVPPTDGDCQAAVDALGALHAGLWAASRLDRDFGRPPTARDVAHDSRLASERAGRFVAFLGDRLSPARRACLRQAVDGLPRLWQWWGRRETRTLVHGDAHAWNFLFPRPAGGAAPAAGVYLVDWQNWQAGPHLEAALSAFVDLDCAEVLAP